MMLGVSSNDGVSGMAEQPHESGSSGGGVDESERSGGGGGNRWPRQETLALLKIRSDMDVAFRDSSLKGPLWEEVSRKMAELGFQRNAKKCKEKFENVYKYHKRTKDGRSSKPDGKSYRFFDQLEALENSPPISFAPPPRALATEPLPTSTNSPMPPQHISTTTTTVSSTNSPNPLSVARPPSSHTAAVPQNTIANNLMNPTLFQPTISQTPPPPPPQLQNNPLQTHTFQPASHQHILNSPLSNSTSSSTSSDEDIQRRRGKKRKWKDFFGRLMKDVIEKQEELQNKFLETLEKRERDRNAREEAWRVQEMARMNREHDLLVQERSIAAAKDAAVIAFLQKVTDQNNLQIPINNNSNAAPAPPPPQVMQVQQQQQQQQQHRIENPQQASRKSPPPPTSIPAPAPTPTPIAIPAPPILTMVTPPTKTLDVSRSDNGGDGFTGASSSRWPKSEVEALIKLRTDLELKYQENGPKGPLWEEISSAMRKLGYNRSSKRCKEKWENINKYFKKVKESNKKRPEDSKTCPYFHQLDAIYKERAKNDVPSFNYTNPGMVPIMAQPEQQWPLPVQQQQQHQQRQHDTVMRDLDHEDSEDNDHEDDDEGDEEEDEDEDQGGGYEIVTNKPPSLVTNAVE